jgi:hypothetical protein
MDTLRHHFGFRHDPFPQNVPVKDLYPLPALEPLRQRVFFALDQKAIASLPEMWDRESLRHCAMSQANAIRVSMN